MEQSFPKRPFRTHGGAHVPHHKNTAHTETHVMPPPDEITLPMTQHIGAPCVPCVKKGDHVYVGTKVADSDAYVSVPIHSSVSGTVKEIKKVIMPGGQAVDAVIITSDGLMEHDPAVCPPPEIKTKQQLADAARASGLVGLGGAGFPAHVKLNVPPDKKIDTLIVNVAECEPYITSDHREALENGKNVLAGIYKIKEILDVHRVIIAIEDNKPDAIEALTRIADDPKMDPNDEVRVLKLHASYPQGAEKVLVQTNWMKEEIVRQCKIPAERVQVKFPPVEMPKTDPWHMEEGHAVFFFPAGPPAYKNHRTFLKACELLKKRGCTDWEAVWTLNGDENDGIRALKKEAEEKALPIRFVGMMSREDLFAQYARSVLVFPSYIETIGLPLLEARSVGAPILAADCLYARDGVGDYEKAEFFETFDAKKLSEMMERFCR